MITIKKNQLIPSAIGLLGGFVLTAGLKGQLPIAIATSIPLSTIAYFVADTQGTNRANQAELKMTTALAEVRKLERDRDSLKSELDALKVSASAQTDRLGKEIETVRNALKIALEKGVESQQVQNDLKASLDALKAQLAAARIERKEALDALEALREGMDDEIESQSHDRFIAAKKTELARIYSETDSVMARAMSLFERLQGWGEKVADAHESKTSTIRSMAAQYNATVDRLGVTVQTEIEQYLEQIELLNVKVARLQREKAGEILEPRFYDGGYSIETNIANDLVRLIHHRLQIPLEVEGIRTRGGDTDIGLGYSRGADAGKIIAAINSQLAEFKRTLGLPELYAARKYEAGNLVVVGFRREPKVKTDDIKAMVGTPEQFLKYVTSNPWRYRLIADPGAGKSPTTAVMVSAMLKAGAFRGNVAQATKVPHTLIDVSYPGAMSSLKDGDDYPLTAFLKYGDNAAAVKSFSDAIGDWEYRKQNPQFAEQFFHLWVWDELDNTITSSSQPQKVGTQIKELLKQGGHANIGYIVSGQSVMTKQIPGFLDDDRSLFTEVVIGVPKIRVYLEKYGKKFLSDSVVSKLAGNLDDIEQWMEGQNARITDNAREYRLALVLDSRSPKLYFLPCLDDVDFDFKAINNSRKMSEEFKQSGGSIYPGQGVVSELTGQVTLKPETLTSEEFESRSTVRSETTIGGVVSLSDRLPICDTCNVSLGSERGDKRRKCPQCKKLKSPSKFIWK